MTGSFQGKGNLVGEWGSLDNDSFQGRSLGVVALVGLLADDAEKGRCCLCVCVFFFLGAKAELVVQRFFCVLRAGFFFVTGGFLSHPFGKRVQGFAHWTDGESIAAAVDHLDPVFGVMRCCAKSRCMQPSQPVNLCAGVVVSL